MPNFFQTQTLPTMYYTNCVQCSAALLRRFLREIAGLDPAPTFVREHKARCAMS